MQAATPPAEAVEEETVRDVEKHAVAEEVKPDVEHLPVQDDPRLWSSRKKWATFAFVCYTSMAAALSANIWLPAIADFRSELHASQQVVNLSVSLFVLFQGTVPILWSGISEIYGRKIVFTSAFALFTVAQGVCAGSYNQALFLVFRILGACGSSAMLAIGAGTLADIYEPSERGTKVGLYYTFPLVGPSLGSFLGGALSLSSLTWRVPFIFLAAYGLTSVIWSHFFFKDTFRQERSLAWIAAFKRAQEAAKAKDEARKAHKEKALSRKPWSRSGTRSPRALDDPSQIPLESAGLPGPAKPVLNGGQTLRKITTETGEEIPVKIHLRDVNPLSAVGIVLRQPNLALAVVSSGLIFGAQYAIAYTAALTFAAPPYSYSSLEVGAIILAFGLGNIAGSVIGGRYSDVKLAMVRKRNGGKLVPEARIRATFIAMPVLPLTYLAYGWTVQYEVPVYGPCIVLFFAGLAIIWIYSAGLTYIVDSSTGMASSAVSCNSAARGIGGFVATQSAQPLLDAIGNGPLYSIWTGLLVLSNIALLIVWRRGRRWREARAARLVEKEHAQEEEEAMKAANAHE